MNQPLKVGIIIDRPVLAAVTVWILQEITNSEYASLDLVLMAESPGEANNNFGAVKRLKNVVGKVVNRHASGSSDIPAGNAPGPHGDEPVDASDILNGRPMLRFKSTVDAMTEAANKEDAKGLDVLLNLSSLAWPDNEASPARYGIWTIVYGDLSQSPRGAPGVWEVIEKRPVACSSLVMYTRTAGEIIYLDRSYTSTQPWSIGATRNLMFWQSATALPRKLKELHRDGEEVFLRRTQTISNEEAANLRSRLSVPSSRQVKDLVDRQRAEHLAENELDQTMMRQWIMLYQAEAEARPNPGVAEFERLTPPADRVWADPFAFEHNGSVYVFFEEHILTNPNGHIAMQVFTADGPVGSPVKVLERPYHLSYPFVFEHENQLSMMPETKGNRAIELYRCVEFPSRWELHRTLLDDIDAVDATLWHDGQGWWMFVGQIETRGAYTWTELNIYQADDPVEGEWRPHALNPVVTDARRARPAGSLFVADGKLYRPAQDGSVGYGYGIRIHEVKELSLDTYREEEVSFIEPDWAPDLCGIHTINHCSGITVGDARIRRNRERVA